jgi:crotonobetainyl-CoA:carnitine CoA-transferase CaiB-like acyl-CoA transferase
MTPTVSPRVTLPLQGITILDATEGLAGPAATLLLADAGARVIKLESSDGDWTRRCLPAAFASWNRGKEGAIVNFADPSDRARLAALLDRADVLVHGLPQADAARYQLDDAAMSERHPAVVPASVTGYPAHHRDAARPGREILVQARLGAMDEQQGLRAGPNFVRMPFASWTAAYLLAGGIVTRLIERAATGAARPIHTSILQGALAPAALYWHRAERPPDWMRRHTLRRDDHPSSLTIFQCADGRWIHALGGFGASEPIREVLTAAGRSELFGKPVTLANREQWAEVFAARPAGEWLDLLWSAGVIAMPILDVGEILGYQQAKANGYAVRVEDEKFGPTIQAGSPISLGVRRALTSAPWTPRHLSEIELLPGPDAEAGRGDPVRQAGAGESAGGPLRAYRFLDFGAYVAGPYGAQCAADFGADVIKIEPPWGERGRTINQFTGCQRGKRSLAIDLQRPEAAEVLRRLLRSADVVMHNIRESAAGRLGIDDAGARSQNAQVIYAHSSAWGTAGPWTSFAAFDPAACAVSGWSCRLTGAGDRPIWLRNSTMDTDTGLSLYLASVLGLYRRLTAGVAGDARTSMLGVATLSGSEVLYLEAERSRTPFLAVDKAQTGISPFYRIYPTADGWIAVAAITEPEQEALRVAFGAEPGPELEDHLRGCGKLAAMNTLTSAGVPAEVVAQDNRDSFFDRELADGSGLIARSVTREYGWFENPAGFWSDGTRALASDKPVPGVGEHTEEILTELGFAAAEITELIATGVVSTEQIAPPAGRVFNVITKSLATRDD